MIRTLAIATAVLLAFAQASPTRVRRDADVDRYCQKHFNHFKKFCRDDYMPMEMSAVKKLAKFCPAYERNCGASKGASISSASSEVDMDMNLVVPPPLPKGADFAALDLPIGTQSKPSHSAVSAASSGQDKQRLTAAIIASCTPDCNAAHCTDECKCAHTHPKVHSMCNPPASAKMADVCQKWYTKCPMFQPLQY